MTDVQILADLKVDLTLSGTAYDSRLTSIIAAAREAIAREGATLHTQTSMEDSQLVVMYAAWLWRRRDSGDAMPRMLRWALNNRVLAEKMAVRSAE